MHSLAYDVVIPTHGRTLPLLSQTIDSVYRQTVPPARVIVVVDGDSGVDTNIRQRWPDVYVVGLPRQSGAAAARQAGIEAATSDWVCFVDDDDLWSRRKSEVTAAYIARHTDCRALRSTYYVVAEHDYEGDEFNGQVIDVRGSEIDELERRSEGLPARNDFSYLDIQGASLDKLLDRNRSVIGTTCVRRDVLAQLPPVPVGTRPGDDHLLACLVATRTEWHLIDEPLMFYRLHVSQDSRIVDPRGVLGILRARTDAWRLCRDFARRPLAAYGPVYRREFRTLIWPLVRGRLLREAITAVNEAFGLLPRWRDRVLLLVPEPIVWRWRYRHRLVPVILRRGRHA